ncbi:MAG: Trehalose synthase [bacterium]|nr:Trehalose synthase [bacterium]
MALQFPRVGLLPLERYATLLSEGRMRQTARRVAELQLRLAGRVVWNVSSTAVGGGVAEMVRSLLAYARGAGVDARWAVMEGTPEFFAITKQLHNALHGSGEDAPLGDEQRRIYEEVNARNAEELTAMVRPDDVVIVHDPQPAGMIRPLVERGAEVIWRCHIGHDEINAAVELGWRFLVPYVRDAAAYVFSRASYVPPLLDAACAHVITPSIDPFSPKNQLLGEEVVHAILGYTGIVAGHADGPTLFTREDGTPGRVDRTAEILRDGPPPPVEAPLVVQVSRWDRLKDPIGVLEGFAQLGSSDAHLVMAGPNTAGVVDDPEGAAVYAATVESWRALPAGVRRRCHLVSLPTVDVGENAAIVNALQRHATVIVQKSLHEGFGLTVSEAMWKERPVVAGAVGGIRDQVDDGVQGLLLRDPTDRAAFAAALQRILGDPAAAQRMGHAGHERVLDRYLGLDSLLRFGALIESLDAAG